MILLATFTGNTYFSNTQKLYYEGANVTTFCLVLINDWHKIDAYVTLRGSVFA